MLPPALPNRINLINAFRLAHAHCTYCSVLLDTEGDLNARTEADPIRNCTEVILNFISEVYFSLEIH
jgi:hypothetical protein